MKRKTLIPILLLAAVFMAAASADLTITYRQLKGSRVMNALLNTENIAYCLSVRQDRDGKFSIEAPPFLTADIDGRIKIGELRDTGLFTLMISPMDHGSRSSRFIRGKNLQDIRSPSMKPRLSGVAFSFDNLDLIALSPVLNPASPLGFGAIGGFSNAFAGIMLASQNDMTIASATEKYQISWKQLGVGRRMVFALLGANAEASLFSFSVEGQAFIQCAWDMYLGGGVTSGWEVKANSDALDISASRRTGGTGVKLKQLSDDDSPMDSMRLNARIQSMTDRNTAMEVVYESDTYRIPVYGGESQRRQLRYSIELFYGAFSLQADNRTSFDADKGKNQSTRYLLSLNGDNLGIQAEFTLNRPDKAPLSAENGMLRITADNAVLSVSKARTELEFSWEHTVKGVTFRASINQDRLVTASLRFSGL
ncbi:MAG: hypothetical protein ILP16_00605 [Spirochaetales bacterium]|nr:hypothetical protein [Spirochaetales bacterium]